MESGTPYLLGDLCVPPRRSRPQSGVSLDLVTMPTLWRQANIKSNRNMSSSDWKYCPVHKYWLNQSQWTFSTYIAEGVRYVFPKVGEWVTQGRDLLIVFYINDTSILEPNIAPSWHPWPVSLSGRREAFSEKMINWGAHIFFNSSDYISQSCT